MITDENIRQAAIAEISFPEREIGDSRYLLRFARDAHEVNAALKLRFDIFNLELGEGLDASYETQQDRDEFDAQCHHLLVFEKKSGAVIGTYRMQTKEMADAAAGFYSSGEFDLSKMPDAVLKQSVEVGRACITKKHRNGRVLFLLWQGLAMYMMHMRKRYLFGCCSLTSQDPDEGKQVMMHLEAKGYVHTGFMVPPLPGLACYPADFQPSSINKVKIPRLFRTYLNYGAKVCSLPVIDRLFKTIDYLVILDIKGLEKQTFRLFFSGLKR